MTVHADRLVGRLDATADRENGVLRVDVLHQDTDFTPAMKTAIDDEIESLAHWLDLGIKRSRPISR